MRCDSHLTGASFKNQELANILWGYATLSVVGGGTGGRQENSDQDTVVAAPEALWGVGSAEGSDPNAIRLCVMALEETANRCSRVGSHGRFSAQQLACTLWASARLGLATTHRDKLSILTQV